MGQMWNFRENLKVFNLQCVKIIKQLLRFLENLEKFWRG